MPSQLRAFLESLHECGLSGRIAESADAIARARENVGVFARSIGAVLHPESRAEVVAIVERANQHRVPLYPFSRGCNWGYGSKLPVGEGNVLLNLAKLDRIAAIDEEMGIATIEPGVSQAALAAELENRGSAHHLDVTGSGKNTSVLGNSLERGVAYQSLRVERVVGMEVLLGNGSLVRTGFGDFPEPILAGLYPHGLGPSLDGLFFQSNLGIVLEIKISLQRNPARLFALSLTIDDRNLKPMVARLIPLLRDKFLHGIPHIADRERLTSTLVPLLVDQRKDGSLSSAQARALVGKVFQGDWALTAAVAGAPKIAAEKLREVKNSLRGLGRLYVHSLPEQPWRGRIEKILLGLFATKEEQEVIAAARELRGFHQGKPSNGGVRFLQTEEGGSIDRGARGFLLSTPLAPLRAENAEFFRDTARAEAKELGVEMAMTLNLVTDRVLEAVVSAHFARDSQRESERAHAFIHKITEKFSARGFYPYRINIDQMKDFHREDSPRAQALQVIRKAFDPNGVIAPLRYE